jgi:hypothetical protein
VLSILLYINKNILYIYIYMKHNKSTKKIKLMRMHSNRMRSNRMRSNRMRSKHTRKLRRHMMGGNVQGVSGDSPTGSSPGNNGYPLTVAGYTPPPPAQSSYAAGVAQNNANNQVKQGGGKRNYRKQKGGTSWLDALYSYTPPPGMMGPVPQPSQSPMANNLILNTTKISVAGQANAQYDNHVCPI